MLASTVCGSETDSSRELTAKGNLKHQKVGSDSYQQNHMDLIFRENLSFSGFERNKVFFGREGGFTDLSRVSGADTESDCRAVLVADFDDDGDCDIFTNAIQRECHHLFRNDLPRSGRNSLKLRLQPLPGRHAIGAIVRVTIPGIGTQTRVVQCGSGFESQDADELIFGLGNATEAKVHIKWPSGSSKGFEAMKSGQYAVPEDGPERPRRLKTFAFADPTAPGVKPKTGDRMESLELLAIDGTPSVVKLASDLPVLVNFWSTTCTSCLAEMPELARLHHEKKYRVVGVSLDKDDRIAVVHKMKKRFKMDFEVYRISDEQVDVLFDLSRLAIPVTFVLAKDGRIQRILQGKIKKGDL